MFLSANTFFMSKEQKQKVKEEEQRLNAIEQATRKKHGRKNTGDTAPDPALGLQAAENARLAEEAVAKHKKV